eukprot:CAMPEP_0172198908 /NCGR_PEP_ID=MMETSP1050-20130122/28366_1 /TAXON_ID=233186 /ORGANISM="Cryptomonas curvata, Strain CCAP979/52" /LENGTH=81 /DNA_ID=CAMNT_0012875817 /DNA_START=185 /DNA_END=430 /DNA_ORIENTATION=+
MGLRGFVQSIWEKCEVDPACCCAENGMEEASVAVRFDLEPAQAARFCWPDGEVEPSFTSYFSTEELRLVSPDSPASASAER